MEYAAAFLDHFEHPRHQGSLPDATHHGRAEDLACGDRLWLDLRVERGVVVEARFRVQGCIGAIACGSALAELLPGRPATADAIGRAELETALGAVPQVKRHALGLALRTLAAALAPR
jgi:nitrogen fixation NifU-like protein